MLLEDPEPPGEAPPPSTEELVSSEELIVGSMRNVRGLLAEVAESPPPLGMVGAILSPPRVILLLFRQSPDEVVEVEPTSVAKGGIAKGACLLATSLGG